MNICVFLSAADLDDRYTRPAREFAGLLGKGGHTLVWMGSPQRSEGKGPRAG